MLYFRGHNKKTVKKSSSSDDSDKDSEKSFIDHKSEEKTNNKDESKNEETALLHSEEDDPSYSSYLDESDDEKQYEEKVTLSGLILNFIQMGIYALDVFSDTFLAVNYAIKRKYLYACLTLAVVYIASGIDAFFNRSELKRKTPNYKYRYFITLLFNVRGLDIYKNLVWMKLELYRGVSSKKETQEEFFDRNFRVANLKTHEGLFEACPQLLLQLYIMLATIEEDASITLAMQILSIFISLCSLAMTFITGDKARRLYEHECDKFSNWGLALQFFWIFPVTASRILSLSCVASVYPIPAISCFGIHGFAAFVYLRLTQPYTSFGALVAAIRMFLTPYEPIEEYDDEVPRRLFRSHLIHLVGNIVAIALWATATDFLYKRFSTYLIILFSFGFGFIIGVTSLAVLLKYKKDCFIQEDEEESRMDRRMKPIVDVAKRLYSGFPKLI